MIFAVDIGNTNIVIGGAERQGKICFTERISTDHKATDFEYAVSFKSIFEIHNVSPHDIEGAIISSVVPFVTNTVKSAVRVPAILRCARACKPKAASRRIERISRFFI